jgi:hypothetical protein
VGKLAWVVTRQGLNKLFLEGLDELESTTVVFSPLFAMTKIMQLQCFAKFRTLHVQILQKRKIQGRLCTVWKLTIILDNRRSDVNPRPHLVTIFDEVV